MNIFRFYFSFSVELFVSEIRRLINEEEEEKNNNLFEFTVYIYL